MVDSRRGTIKQMIVLTVTFMLAYAAYTGVLNLQSSINIEEGLGTMSMLSIYVASAVSSFCIAPFFLDYLGTKAALILGEIGFAVYVAANFYPSWAVFMILSVVHGILENVPFTAAYIFVIYLAEQYWKKVVQEAPDPSKVQPLASYTQRAVGYLSASLSFAQIVGNTLSSAVFLIFDNIDGESSTNTTDPPTSIPNTTETKYFDLTYCGANDCQADYVFNGTEAELSKYQPSLTGIYFLLTLFLSMVIAGVVVQGIWLPAPPLKRDEKSKENGEANDKQKTSFCSSVKNYFLDIGRYLISPLNLLMTTSFYYAGIMYGYNIAEYPRAYVSCVVGVEQVGIAMTIRGAGAGTASALFTFIQPRIGNKRFVLLTGSTHLTTYLLSLLWQPSYESVWVVYLLAVLVGINEGFLFCIVDGLTAVYFKDRLSIAFSISSLVTSLGLATTTGWSTALCVSTKLYINITILVVCVVTLLIADWRFNLEQRRLEANVKNLADKDDTKPEETQFL